MENPVEKSLVVYIPPVDVILTNCPLVVVMLVERPGTAVKLVVVLGTNNGLVPKTVESDCPVVPAGPAGPVGPDGPGTVESAPAGPVRPAGPVMLNPAGPAGPSVTFGNNETSREFKPIFTVTEDVSATHLPLGTLITTVCGPVDKTKIAGVVCPVSIPSIETRAVVGKLTTVNSPSAARICTGKTVVIMIKDRAGSIFLICLAP